MWGDKKSVIANISATIRTLDWIWKNNGSVSLYMAHGGTNFGFWTGALSGGPVGFNSSIDWFDLFTTF